MVGAFADVIGVDFDTAVRIGSGFGGGMGRLREVCGTFSGAVMVINMLYGYSDPKNVQAKAELYARIQELAAQFRRDNGSLICKELLGWLSRRIPRYRRRARTNTTRNAPVRNCADTLPTWWRII